MEIVKPSQSPKARIVLIHGMGDHSNALPYCLVADHLVKQGVEVYRFDLPGHGQSEGEPMYVKSWNEFINACEPVIKEAQSKNDCPVFLVGLSMGGLIALNYAAQFPVNIKGVVVASPALDSSGTPAFIKALVPLLARIIPKKQIDLKLDITNISRNEAAVKEYTSDPLFYTKTTPKMAAAILSGMKQTHLLASSFSIPVLMQQGTADKIVPAGGAKNFFNKLSVTDKTLKEYPGAFHNLFIEPENEIIFGDISQWILDRLK